MSKPRPLDPLQTVPSEDHVDWSDRQNLADTATAPERRAPINTPPTEHYRREGDRLKVTPFPARMTDPGRLGQSGWFQQSQILTAPARRNSPLTTFVLMAGVTFVSVGSLVWIFFR